jgi:hypothetical protein
MEGSACFSSSSLICSAFFTLAAPADMNMHPRSGKQVLIGVLHVWVDAFAHAHVCFSIFINSSSLICSTFLTLAASATLHNTGVSVGESSCT